jgi:hypothetical protein
MPVHRRDGRMYVAGKPGSRYAIRLVNHSAGRVLVVLSVDGVNVVTGQTAGWNQGGYVLDPWVSSEIAGWRKSDSVVAAFEFAALPDSYAARTGRPENVGVIGMAVFFEKVAPSAARREAPAVAGAPPAEAARSEAAAGAAQGLADAASPGAAERRVIGKLGTAHGQREVSLATRTQFDRLSPTPNALVEIAYDSHDNLVAAGIIRATVRHANAFPMSPQVHDFVPDPPPR